MTENLVNAKLIAFISGVITSSGSAILFSALSPKQFILFVPYQIIATFLVCVIGGVGGLIARDFYYHKIRKRLFKK